jgi:putative hydrolase of the HAD superfamily
MILSQCVVMVFLENVETSGMTIRAVFFDMGGTIETFWHTPELRLQATPDLGRKFQQAGIDLHLSDQELYQVISSGLERYHKWSLETLEELPVIRVWSEFIFSEHPVDLKKLVSCAEDLMVFIELNYFHREMRPEVPQVLDVIRKVGLKIGLISNVCSQSQVPLSLNNYAILDYFDPIVLSSVYGRRKPDPAIFHYAARLANVPTSECLYIGDRIARDVVGARRAGFHLAVQIINDFDHGEEDDGAEPDAVITHMTELLEILKTDSDSPSPASLPSIQNQNKPRALLFDAGDILYFRPERGQKFVSFLKEFGLDDIKIPAREMEDLKEQAFHGLITQEQFREAVLRLYGVDVPEQIQRGKQAMQEDDNNIQFFKGVRETLISLKEHGYLLGIITDSANPIHVKLRWFEDGGFVHVWDSIITSQDIGIQKPAPEIYAAALQQLGLSADQAVFIGHDVDELKGARTAGMKTIAFNYAENAMADFYIDNFPDLLTVPIISSK